MLAGVLSAAAQDIIITNDGNEIEAIVSEITETQIKYHSFSNPEGPIYSIKKANVLLIKYPNGKKELISSDMPKTAVATEGVLRYGGRRYYVDKNRVSKSEFNNLLKSDPQAYAYLKKANTYKTVCFVGAAISVACFAGAGVGISNYVNSTEEDPKPLFLIGILTGFSIAIVDGLVIGENIKKNKAKAVNVYNSNLTASIITKPQPVLDLAFTGTGVALTLKF